VAGLALVVGLGNPGRQYEGTRHNVGFRVLDEILLRQGAGTSGWHRADGAAMSQLSDPALGRVALMKPELFMNLSGKAVAPYVQFHKIPAASVVVVHDDIDLPVGALRVRVGGGDGGHNGIRSIITSLGSGDFVRVKVGVGRPSGALAQMEVADWVLSRFSGEEEAVLADVVASAAAACFAVLREGPTVAQNRHNRSPG